MPSAVGPLYFCSRSFSSEPALTPMRMGILRSDSGLDHFFDIFARADVAGVEAQAVDALLDGDQRQFVIEMDVGDQRDANFFLDLAELLGRFAHRHGTADDFAAGRFQGPDLLHRGAHVAGVGLGHRLDRDRRIAADFHIAQLNLPGFAPFNHGSTIENRVPRVN